MSGKDQEHFKKLAGMLPSHGKWRWVVYYLAVPSIIGATTAILALLLSGVNFYQGVKFAITVAPVHAKSIDSLRSNQAEDRWAIKEIEDTLGLRRLP